MGYSGSQHTDVSFFSFSPIKTATALGARGLAILRDTDDDAGDDDEDVDAPRDQLSFAPHCRVGIV